MLWFKILLTVVFALQLISVSVFEKEMKEEDETAVALIVIFLGFLIAGIWTVL